MINWLLDITAERLGLDVRYYAKSSFYLTLIQIFNIFLGFILSIVFANYLSAMIFGQYNFIFSFVSLFLIFAYPGLDIVVSRGIARGKEGLLIAATKKVIPWAILGSSLFLPIIVYYIFKSQIDWQIIISFSFCLILTPFIWTLRFGTQYFASKKEFAKVFFSSLFQKGVNFVFIVAAVFFFKNLFSLVFSSLLADMLSLIAIYSYILPKIINKKVILNNFSKDFVIAKKLNLAIIFSQLAFYLDKIIIGKFLGFEAVAIYSFALLMPEQIKFFFKTIITTAQPKLANFSKLKVKQKFLKKTYPFLLSTLGVTLIYWFLSPVVFDYFFPLYRNSIFFSQIISLSLPFGIATILIAMLFESQGKVREINNLNVINSISQLILSLFLIPFFGISGAIGARLLSRIIGFSASIILFKRAYIKS